MKRLFVLEDSRIRRLVTNLRSHPHHDLESTFRFGTKTNVMYFDNKMKAKSMRAQLHKDDGLIESDCWEDNKQVVPYRYVIKRGPDHYRGATRV